MIKVENVFVAIGRKVIDHPKTALILFLLVFGSLLSQLPRLVIDTSAESFLRPDAKPILDYNRFRYEFGRDEFFVVMITGEDVLNLEFLEAFEALHHDLEMDVERVQSVESLVNVRSIYGEEDDLIAEDLLENMPQNQEELDVIVNRIRGKSIYYGRLINEKEDTAAIFVKLQPYIITDLPDGTQLTQNLSDELVAVGSAQIQAVVDNHKKNFAGEIHVGGTQALGAYLSGVIQKDFGTFTGVALLFVSVILAFLFRRVSGVLIPIAVMAFGIATTIATMPLLGYPMQITTSILPSFLLAVCIGDAVHLLTIFFRAYDGGKSKHDAILYALSHTGIAVLFTSMTTAAGLLTFSISEIQPVASLGIFAAIGSILAFLLTITMIPILLVLFPVKHKPAASHDPDMIKPGLLKTFTDACIHLSTQHPIKVVVVALLIGGVALAKIPDLRFSQDSMMWLGDDVPVKRAVQAIEANITGSMPLEVIIDTGADQGVLEPEFLQKLDVWLASLEGKKINGIEVMSVNSITNLIKETHQAFNGNVPEQYRIPDDKELVAQELLLIEMDEADDLYQYTDSGFRKARITIILPWADAIVFKSFQELLMEDYRQAMGDDYGIEFTGVIPIFSTMFSAMIASAANSYLIAALAIGFMMILLMRGVVDGLLSMIPNLLPIVVVLAFMAAMDIPMDVFTILIGSIALGLCVDDTVHFMHGFKRAYAKHGDAEKAIYETLHSTGKALVITTVVLFFGFLTFTLSDLINMDNFGMLTAMCIVFALFSDFIVAPALMTLRYGRQPKLVAQTD
ncbi:Uncharacterised protein [BD1-7 clade bacterium]|uniref:Uncharacterized protein n=1 Tax=BD1-7 clade bacterium TaxID=2029982 RepID=A0A5S9Q4Z3_9GAMM|nr:Uncharacterised protein [BD1-7 clade bacterium]CAA0112246.1 Uncharacterised protein [BD1-7 clade bacterium]